MKIVCEAFGEPPITLSWSKDRIPFQPIKEPRYILIEQTSNQQQSSSRTIPDMLSSNVEEQQPKVRLTSMDRLNTLQALKDSSSYINILEINQTDRRDSVLFTCISSNPYGKDEYNVQIIVQGKF